MPQGWHHDVFNMQRGLETHLTPPPHGLVAFVPLRDVPIVRMLSLNGWFLALALSLRDCSVGPTRLLRCLPELRTYPPYYVCSIPFYVVPLRCF